VRAVDVDPIPEYVGLTVGNAVADGKVRIKDLMHNYTSCASSRRREISFFYYKGFFPFPQGFCCCFAKFGGVYAVAV
jgi:hypothetical protein